MSARTDKPPAPARFQFWQPAGLAWLAANLAGLAVGLFPGLIVVADSASAGPPPALRTLAAGQAAFLLLAYPLILAHRVRRAWPIDPASPRPTPPGLRVAARASLAEAIVWILLAVPFVGHRRVPGRRDRAATACGRPCCGPALS